MAGMLGATAPLLASPDTPTSPAKTIYLVVLPGLAVIALTWMVAHPVQFHPLRLPTNTPLTAVPTSLPPTPWPSQRPKAHAPSSQAGRALLRGQAPQSSSAFEPRRPSRSSIPMWLASSPFVLGLLASGYQLYGRVGRAAPPPRCLQPLEAKGATEDPRVAMLITTTTGPFNGESLLKVPEPLPAPKVPPPTPRGLKHPIFAEKCEQVGITLTRFMTEMVRANPDLSEVENVFASIQTAGKAISKLVQRAPLDGMLGLHGKVNVQGEDQKKLDVIANDLLKRHLKYSGRMGVIASEEESDPVRIDNTAPAAYELEDEDEEGRFVTVFDPLDGSSNVDAGIPVGTIFGIFQRDNECVLPDKLFLDKREAVSPEIQRCLTQTMRAGKSFVAAGYVLYSSSTFFVFTMGAGVHGFTLDTSLGEFILTHPNIQIPSRGKIYSVNAANRRTWDKPMQVFLDSLADGTNRAGTEYTSRYIGSMVGDVHRTLMYGGVFAYPADSKNSNGKLRLLYEAAPMSFLIEQAGGRSSTGVVRIMDIPPSGVHQRVPCIMGGRDEMDELEDWYRRLGGAALLEAHQNLLRVNDE